MKTKQREVYENSRWIMASYNMNQFFLQWITGPFGMYVFYFYESEIGLSAGLAALAFVLFSIWNSINDPLIGYLMEKFPMPWEKRWGKRFPWIVIASVPWLVSFALIFLVPFKWDPVADKWLIFTWLLLSTCLFDTLFTVWTVAVTSLYPDKFRGLNERRTAAGIGTLIGITGIVSSSVIPPLFIKFGIPDTFRTMAWVLIGIGLIFFLMMLPGVREDEKTRACYRKRLEEQKADLEEGFFKTAKTVLSNRTFIVKIIFFFGYQAAVTMLSASAPYIANFVLDKDPSAISILMGCMLGGALISVPLWIKLSHRVDDNRKMSILAGILMTVTLLPMAFISQFNIFLVVLFFFGIGLGAQWFVDPPAMGDILDDVYVRTGKKQEAVYYGYQAFFIKFGHSFQAATFAVVHRLTGFVEGAKSQADLASKTDDLGKALWGIKIHTALVPAILVAICTILFWRYYNLTPEKIRKNREKMKEMS
ncbi:MAG: MFS transporter [Spirochaetales bacterium]|nr:MFS transporter [Spirochaetales bacterium]